MMVSKGGMKMKVHLKWKLYGLISGWLLVICFSPAITMNIAAAEEPAHHEADSEPKGILDKPVMIKGTGIKVQFGGFAKVDFMQDLNPIGNADQFKVNTIPVSGDPDSELGSSTNISARQTRLSADVLSDAASDVHAYVEGDFFGDGNSFRMRHGYGEWKGILGGQTWSTFQDISARPFTLDYEGPDSEIFVRQPQIRYTGTPSEQFSWAVAVEDPDSQISVSTGDSGNGRSNLPDIPANVRFMPEWGHIQFGAIVRQLRFVSDDGGVDESTLGYGLNLSGKLKVAQKDALMGHIGFGSGIGRYIESFGGTNSDAVLTPSGDLEALDTWAFVLGYTHHWNDQFNSTLSGGMAKLDNDSSQPDDAIKAARSGHLNLVYAPNRLINLGGEVMWGERENKDGDSGDAVRLQFSIQYKFR